MKAKEFDMDFDGGKSIVGFLDLPRARRPLQEEAQVNINLPLWMISSLDRQASRLGVTQQSIIKIWLAERLQQLTS